MLDAYIIDVIRRQEEEKRSNERRIQLELPSPSNMRREKPPTVEQDNSEPFVIPFGSDDSEDEDEDDDLRHEDAA